MFCVIFKIPSNLIGSQDEKLIYTIRPIREALELNYQRQFLQAERDIERAKAEKRLAELNRQNEKEESA